MCRKSSGGFRSREHPFPESLGNTEIILPAGVVCDRCNSGVLSQLDQAICDFMPIKMRRTMLGIRSKAGVVPSTRLDGALVEHVGPDTLRFVGDNGRDVLKETFRAGDLIGLRFDVRGGRRMTPRYGALLSRSLLKTALELAWLDGGDAFLGSEFDHVRAAVLGEPRSGFLAVGRKGDPNHYSATMTYNPVKEEQGTRVAVVAQYFGIALATDSILASPPTDITAAASILRFSPQDWPRIP